MKLFFRISICLLVFSCASYPIKNNFQNVDDLTDIQNPYFSDPNQDYIYKAKIDVYDNTFGGIFIIKKIGEKHHRLAFTTEMGNKIFDFSFNKDDFKVNYILKDLDKKIIINILKRDFKILISEKFQTQKTFVLNGEIIKKTEIDKKLYYYFETPELSQILRVKNGKEKVRFLFKEINGHIAQRIQILHSNIKLNINLKAIF
jgi:hypothetical protein